MNVLTPIHEGLLFEIPSFGLECSDEELNRTIHLQEFDFETDFLRLQPTPEPQ